MAFFLFILVNAALFIRPGEIVPALLGWEIYFYVILACLIAAAPDVLRTLSGQPLDTQPITLSVFGMLIAILLPSLLAGDMGEAWRTGFYFAKVIVYFLLFVSLVTTPARFRILLSCILAFCSVVTLLAVLRYHDVIHLETIETLKDSVSGDYGATIDIKRLQGTGIFQDPNELCVLLSAMLPLSLYFFLASRNIFLKVACVGMAPLFGYAVFLTQSRGGFIAFLGGLAVLSWIRLGWRKTALVGAIGVPALLFLFAGRQTDISTSTGTAQTRVELWRDWLTTFRENPLFGKGMTLKKDEDPSRPTENLPEEERRHEAHNAYLQAFADLGIFGGCLFVGAFVTAGWSIYRLQTPEVMMLNRDLQRMQPYVLAALAAYAIGMMTLSIPYTMPTFLMLALSVAHTRMAQRSCLAAPPPLRLDIPLLVRFLAAGICTLGMIYVFVRFLA
jgi:putative inorganic carbon (hco3(-)) transporter